MKYKKLVASLLTGALAFGTIGCTKATEEQTPQGTNLEGTTLKVVAAYGGKEEIFSKFTEDTGVKVEFIDMSSGEVLSRIKAENGKPMADIWFGGGVDSFIAAKNAGLIEAYKSPEAETIPAEYKDSEGYWTGISLVAVGFMTNNDLLKEKGLDTPKTWEDLTDHKYKGEVMMADPSVSGTNYAMVSGLIQSMGEEKSWDYFSRLMDNVPFLAKRGSEPANKVNAGEFALGIVPMSGEFFAMEKQSPVTLYYPEDVIPWVPAPVSIFKNAENLDAAKAFVDWALSLEGQKFIQQQDPRYMTRPEVGGVAELKDMDSSKLVELNMDLVGNDRDAILTKWDEMFGSKKAQ